ncbi:MAG: peptide deformylase [Pseudomonadota bacterium]
MAIRKIITYPDPLLQRVAKPVEKFDSKLAALVADMVETMRYAPGIGLAAPQVGESIRLIIVEVKTDEEESPAQLYAVCNPEITRRAGEAKIEEGCLSCPGLYVEIERSAEVTVEGENPDGTRFILEAEGLLAICFLHEIDHLDGKLLVSYVSPLRREAYRKEIQQTRVRADGTPDDRRKAL